MIKHLAALALLIGTATAAYAGPRGPFYPPPEYDHPFAGKTIVVKEWDQDVLKSMGGTIKNPPRTFLVIGGTSVGGYKGACIIFVGKKALLKERGYAVEDVVRHETGHCNGWKHPTDKDALQREEKELRAYHLSHKLEVEKRYLEYEKKLEMDAKAKEERTAKAREQADATAKEAWRKIDDEQWQRESDERWRAWRGLR